MIEPWGTLPKSQESSQTIEERVAEMIAEHEEDPEAHLGAGESIEVHRTQTVLDHPQGSVVADKRQVSQLEIYTAFESVTGWTKNTGTFFNELGYCGITTTTTLNQVAEMMLEDGMPVETQELVKSPMFQVAFQVLYITNVVYNLNLSLLGEIDNYIGIGFRITNAAMVGLFHDGATLHSVSLGNVAINTTYVVRAFVNIALNQVEFWVNGVMLGTVTFEQHYTGDDALMPYFSVKRTGGTGTREMFIQTMFFARDF